MKIKRHTFRLAAKAEAYRQSRLWLLSRYI